VRGEHVEEVKSQLARLAAETGVVVGLAAAGLGLGEFNFNPEPLQHFHHRFAHGGVEGVHDAGDKELNAEWPGHAEIISPAAGKH
jgi:hypothetical protein